LFAFSLSSPVPGAGTGLELKPREGEFYFRADFLSFAAAEGTLSEKSIAFGTNL